MQTSVGLSGSTGGDNYLIDGFACLEHGWVPLLQKVTYALQFKPPLKTLGFSITTIVYLRIGIIEIGSTIILMGLCPLNPAPSVIL